MVGDRVAHCAVPNDAADARRPGWSHWQAATPCRPHRQGRFRQSSRSTPSAFPVNSDISTGYWHYTTFRYFISDTTHCHVNDTAIALVDTHDINAFRQT